MQSTDVPASRAEAEQSSREPPRSRRLDDLCQRFEQAIEGSVADETELVWLDSRRRSLLRRPGASDRSQEHDEHSLQVRTRVAGRFGTFRCSAPTRGEIADGVRRAIAQGRAHDAIEQAPPLPGPEQPQTATAALCDPRLAEFDDLEAQRLLDCLLHEDEAAQLHWQVGEIAVLNSHGLRRTALLSSVWLEVRSGADDEGAGFATGASRQLSRDHLDTIVALARSRRGTGPAGAACVSPCDTVPLLLAPEAVAQLVTLLNRRAFAAEAYRSGESFLRQHSGVQVFDQRVSLRDDGTDSAGLPLPFDLEGRTREPVQVIERGVPRTPLVDTLSAAQLGVAPTASCVGGAHGYGLHLFLEAGDDSLSELYELADGGVWVSRIERLESFDPERMMIRAHLRGARRLRDGAPAENLGPLVWEDSLLRILSNLSGLGSHTVVVPSNDGLLGGTSAPAAAIREATLLPYEQR